MDGFDYTVFAAKTYSDKYAGKFSDSINHIDSISIYGWCPAHSAE